MCAPIKPAESSFGSMINWWEGNHRRPGGLASNDRPLLDPFGHKTVIEAFLSIEHFVWLKWFRNIGCTIRPITPKNGTNMGQITKGTQTFSWFCEFIIILEARGNPLHGVETQIDSLIGICCVLLKWRVTLSKWEPTPTPNPGEVDHCLSSRFLRSH